MSGEARWPPEVLRAGSGVGVEVGTAGHVWQSDIYIRMRDFRVGLRGDRGGVRDRICLSIGDNDGRQQYGK
jgi:hypothetical protein